MPGTAGSKTDVKNAPAINTSPLGVALASLVRDKFIAPTSIAKGNSRSYEGYKLVLSQESVVS